MLATVLAVVLGVEALAAVPSGALMMLWPDGTAFGLPLSMLELSPFESFLVPGALLFTFLGLLPAAAAWLLLTDPSTAWAGPVERATGFAVGWLAAGASGVAIVVWIATQVVMLRGFHPLHAIFGGVGLVAVTLALSPSVRAWARRHTRRTAAVAAPRPRA